MKNSTLHKLLIAFACTALLGGLGANGLFAAGKENKANLLDALHAGNGVSCADCHGDNSPREAVSMLACLECHDTEDLAKATADIQPTNPHKNRHYSTETDCNLCHHQHKTSENFCLPCHVRFDFVVP